MLETSTVKATRKSTPSKETVLIILYEHYVPDIVHFLHDNLYMQHLGTEFISIIWFQGGDDHN
jgi:hypothetical protein